MTSPPGDAIDPAGATGARGVTDLSALSPWAPELARTFVSLATDIALVLDRHGVIQDVAQGGQGPIAPADAGRWVGRPWIDTVTGETRGKIEQMLADVADTGLARRREVSHTGAGGATVPVAYTAIRLGADGPLLAVGRDLRAIAAIQQRYLDSQRELERGYWRARQAESRYRTLFQVATDAVLVVDAQTLQIAEANPAASQLFDLAVEQLRGRPLHQTFERASRAAVDQLLLGARASGRATELRARLLGKVGPVVVAATPIRGDDATRLLVRVHAGESPAGNADVARALARLVDGTRDGVVVTDSSGRIELANPAFAAMVQQAGEAELRDRPLSEWIRSEGADGDGTLAALLAQVRRTGVARQVSALLRVGRAPPQPIAVSAVLLAEGDQERIGFTMHPSIEPQGSPPPAEGLRDALEQVVAQLGSVPLPQLLRQVGTLAERHFVALALERSGGDEGQAAQWLGVGRTRLRRQRRADGAPPPSTDPPLAP